jgi:nucleotide-binding universal stress UspA family protein
MIKDIVVHLTGSEEDEIRILHAEGIARALDAHITGLLVHTMPEVIAVTDPTGSAYLQQVMAESASRADAGSDKLRARLDQLGLRYELRRLDVVPSAVGTTLASEARTSDLFIGTRPYGDPTGGQRIEETVLFRSGRGCLFVPPHDKPEKSTYDTVFVAWKPTREAARAVAESLPFLRRASQVIVGLVEEDGAGEQYKIEAGGDIGRYLSRHDVSAEVRKIAGWAYAGEALLNEAQQVGADLLVMGGFGHSRFVEWVLGGATRHILSNAPIPVLTAH